ncbi:Na+ dependent nucleoside transporter C-terminus-domain-containing protein [Radiomyces spectabilis]|uniref:Na+ dependent nucleoside transporter C-terminus-domain-containing protein n=1 Tax=Radiomyces spectabilis TaxID=64574 RepID=UPI00221F5E0A|nr:Na+ dependent nucleoside transporter C-terminus-domain-containing protein [Radiomyces spectabilis]KAI8369358.1 Na+ dependent nucleoside transporter C-terminus-domain-containing protein [Radiomyces spectabilis]
MDEFEAAERRAAENDEKNMGPSKIGVYYQKYLFWCHLVMWLLFTGFLIAAYVLQVPKGYNQENLILGLIYAWFTIYIFFSHVPKTIVTKPWMFCVRLVAKPIYMIPELYRKIAYGLFVLAVIVVTVFSMPERPESNRVQRIIALFGMVIFLGGVFLCSKHHRAVNWNTVSSAILIQFLLALFVFRSKPGHDIFNWASKFAQGYLGKSSAGSSFVFGDAAVASGVFAMNVFPTIIFFAATVQCLYYMGALQWLLKKCAVVFKSVLNVSGAEAVVAVASPFLGQGENALLIKPFMPYLTTSEMHQVMTSGFATISGSVLYGYIAMGVPGDALLTSCVMSIPCSLAISKLRMPEVDEPLTSKEVRIPPSDEKHANILHAAGGGAAIGINIVLLMIANLVSLLALLEAVNAGLTWVGNFITIHELTLQLITGYIFVPVAWLIGVDNQDLVKVGQLLAWKIWANEFVAYQRMVDLWEAGELTARSHLVTIYALCGFANLGSVGMQIGILSSMAPKRSGEISRLAVSSMLCGAVSTWVSASIAGMLL